MNFFFKNGPHFSSKLVCFNSGQLSFWLDKVTFWELLQVCVFFSPSLRNSGFRPMANDRPICTLKVTDVCLFLIASLVLLQVVNHLLGFQNWKFNITTQTHFSQRFSFWKTELPPFRPFFHSAFCAKFFTFWFGLEVKINRKFSFSFAQNATKQA